MRGSVRAGGFVASVAGTRRGKGSSREASPYAEMHAGIRIVIAESIERIYRENCQNLGVFTSTDFSLIQRIRNGEEIALEELTRGEGGISRGIVEYGGLFNYNVARLQGKVEVPVVTTPKRPMTIAEKIFARHWVLDAAKEKVGIPAVQPGDQGFVRTDIRFSHEYVTPMAAIFFEELVGKDEPVNDPESVFFFRDHLTFLSQVMRPEHVEMGLLDVANQLEAKQRIFAGEKGIKLYGELDRLNLHGALSAQGSEAICHSKILEAHAEPGQIIIGSDSHTPHAGAVGCIAFGVGTTAIFNSWITKDVRVEVPPTFRVTLRGKKPRNVTAKDFMLEILRHPYIKGGSAIGQIIEYAGDAVASLSVDERATMTNMAAEVGAFTGIIAPDEKTVEYLVAQRGMSPEAARALCDGLYSDDGATYVQEIEIDAAIDPSDDRAPGRSRKRHPHRRHAGRREDRHRVRGLVHGRKEGRHGHVREGVQRGARARREGGGGRALLHPVRIAGSVRVLPGEGIRRGVRGGRRDAHRAVVRRVHQRGARRLAHARRSHDLRDQPQFPGTLGSGAALSRVAIHRRRVGDRRPHRRVGCRCSPARACIVRPRAAIRCARVCTCHDSRMRGEFVDVGGVRLYYYAAGNGGEGEPIVFLHGFPTSSHIWRDVVPLVPDGHRVVVVDLLGYGRSDRPEGRELSIKAHAERVLALLDVLRISYATVIGHDLGGGIAQYLAVRHPTRVARLGLVSSVAFDSGRRARCGS